MDSKQTQANQVMMVRVKRSWNLVLDEVLQQGFHGTAKVELLITNGTIQRISRTVERIEK